MSECDVCRLKFATCSSFRRHQRTKHNIFKYNCELCARGWNRKTQIMRHLQDEHHFPKPASRPPCKKGQNRIICPLCKSALQTYEKLYQHLGSEHNTPITREQFTLDDRTSFTNWKLQMEKETRSKYNILHSRQRSNGRIVEDYVCHRSYARPTKTEGRKKALKSLGTNKTGVACPSRIIVEIANRLVRVTFIGLHVGHSCEISRTTLTKNERAEIAEMLSQGVPAEQILKDIRNTADAQNLDRIHLIKRQDLRNIRRDFKLGRRAAKTRLNDPSVDSLVRGLREREHSVVLHYANNDGHFSLVIMTPSQTDTLIAAGRNIYVDRARHVCARNPNLRLMTLSVIDGVAIPVAFFLSSREDAATLFFEKVKQACGQPIRANVFISDDVAYLYAAWEQVMGPAELRLRWTHVNENLNADLESKVKNVDKRELVRKTLYVLGTRIEDATEFELILPTFLQELRRDEEMRDFCLHFDENYVARAKCWAFCYRNDVDEAVERLHESVGACLEGRVRLDEAIQKLLDLSKETALDRLARIAKKEPTETVGRLRRSHARSARIDDDHVSRDPDNPGTWYVASQKDKCHVMYVVQAARDNCAEGCVLKCVVCDACVHTHQCSCIDNRVYLNVCEHMHKVGTIDRRDGATVAGLAENRTQVTHFLEVQIADTNAKLKDATVAKLETILEYAKRIDKNDPNLAEIHDLLDRAFLFMQTCVSRTTSSVENDGTF